MNLQELKTTVVIGWLCPAIVIVIVAFPRLAALLGLALLACLVRGWRKDLRNR